MQNPNVDLNYGYLDKKIKKVKTNKVLKKNKPEHRSYKSFKYAEIGFTITKLNNKYVAICKMCKRALGNTAYARLKGHRNICKLPAVDIAPEYNPYFPSNGQTFSTNPSEESYYITNTTDPVSLECTSQTSDDSSRVPFNTMTPKIELVESQYVVNHNPYTQQDNQILDEENQINLKILEVLLLIRLHKHKLFDSSNEACNQAWIEVLRKAQSLGLAPENAHWSYAKDSLFPTWKHRTLTKKEAMDPSELNTKLDIVDLTILQIENFQPLNRSFHLGEEMFHTDGHQVQFESESNKQREIINLNRNDLIIDKFTSVSTQTIDEMYEAELHLKLLQCEALEIQNYKSSLEALEMERKLDISPSKFTAKFVPNLKTTTSTEITDHKASKNIVKIEIDD